MGRIIFRLFLTIALTLAVAYYAGWPSLRAIMGGKTTRPAAQQQQSATPVSVTTVVRQDVPRRIKVVGTVVPYQSVAIRSRLDSQIMEVKFRDGDTVKKGDVLFLLDDRALKAQLVQVQANLTRDKAQFENLKTQYSRAFKLSEKGYVSSADRDNAKAALDVAAATVGADEAALENTRVQINYSVITTPIDGRTGTINVTAGNTVKANDSQPLVSINQIQPILVQASLPQSSFDEVREAITMSKVSATARRDGSDVSSEGMLQYIDNTVDQGTGTFVTRAVFENMDERLWPGMLVTLSLQLGEDKQAVVVPEVALQHDQSGDYLFTVSSNTLHKRPVKIARIENGLALIAEGVQENEIVVTDGFMNLKDGLTVTIQKQP